MPKFKVMLVRATTKYAFVEIEADTASQAEELAGKREVGDKAEWELSCDSEPHWVDDDSTEEIDE